MRILISMQQICRIPQCLGAPRMAEGKSRSKGVLLLILTALALITLRGAAQGESTSQVVLSLIRALQSEEAEVRNDVSRTLANFGPPVVPYLIDALSVDNKYVRLGAADALQRIGPDAKQAVAALVATMRQEDTMVRIAAINALRGIGPDAQQAVPAIIRIQDESQSVRVTIKTSLREIGVSPALVPQLMMALQDEIPAVRAAAADRLEAVGPDAKPSVGALVAILRDQDNVVRVAAIEALGGIGHDAWLSVIALLRQTDEDKDIRTSVENSLRKIGPPPAAVPQLAQVLRDQDKRVAIGAVTVLGAIGPDARAAMMALLAVLRDSDGTLRAEAAKALRKILP